MQPQEDEEQKDFYADFKKMSGDFIYEIKDYERSLGDDGDNEQFVKDYEKKVALIKQKMESFNADMKQIYGDNVPAEVQENFMRFNDE